MILANLHLPPSLETQSCVVSLHEVKALYRSHLSNSQMLWSCKALSLCDFCLPSIAFWKNLEESQVNLIFLKAKVKNYIMRWRGDYKVIIISTFWIGLAFRVKNCFNT